MSFWLLALLVPCHGGELALPFPWVETRQWGESSVLLVAKPGEKALARLAFPAQKVVQIQASNRSVVFEPADWKLSEDGLTLEFANPRGIPILKPEDLFPPAGSPNSYRHRVGYPQLNLLYGPGSWFHNRQVEITYETRNPWNGPKPESSADRLPRFTSMVRAGKPITLGISGDSISTGLDSSQTAKVIPHQPGYAELVAKSIEQRSRSQVTLVNRAVSGTSIVKGIEDLPRMMETKPDLLVVAFGMNDVGRRDPDWFGNQIGEFLQKAKGLRPDTEFLLVSPMMGHREWFHTPREMFNPYREAMRKHVGQGVAMADVTQVWEVYLKNKHDLDLTGNGLNHPNDFGHRLYAATLLTALGYAPKP